jgi:integrase/recombinase XerC
MASKSVWGRALERYETGLRAANRSPGTVRLHRHYLAQLRARHRSPWQVTTHQLRELLATPGWGAETRKSARTVFRGFYKWALLEGLVEADPAVPLPAIKVFPGVPRPAPEGVLELLLSLSDDRLVLMAMLAAFGGLRACEIAQVHARDLVGDLLMVRGKGSKLRAVPIEDDHLLWRLEQLDGWAFPNWVTGEHITPGHVSRLMSRAMPGDWTAHTLRHRCATVALAGTGNIYAVSQLLGHTRVETTQRYALLPSSAVREAVRAASSRPGGPPGWPGLPAAA